MVPAQSVPLVPNLLQTDLPAQLVEPINNSSMVFVLACQDMLSTLLKFVQPVPISPMVLLPTDSVQSALEPWFTMVTAAANAPQAKSSKEVSV